MIMTCSECGYYEYGKGCIWQSRAPDDIPPCEEEDVEYLYDPFIDPDYTEEE